MSGFARCNEWETEIDLAHLARVYDVTLTDLLSDKQNQHLVDARAAIAQDLLIQGLDERQIASLLNRDRTTIYHYKDHL